MSHHDPGPLPPDVAERSRRLLAQRLGHPPETVAQCIELEHTFPGWGVWYAPTWPDGQPR